MSLFTVVKVGSKFAARVLDQNVIRQTQWALEQIQKKQDELEAEINQMSETHPRLETLTTYHQGNEQAIHELVSFLKVAVPKFEEFYEASVGPKASAAVILAKIKRANAEKAGPAMEPPPPSSLKSDVKDEQPTKHQDDGLGQVFG